MSPSMNVVVVVALLSLVAGAHGQFGGFPPAPTPTSPFENITPPDVLPTWNPDLLERYCNGYSALRIKQLLAGAYSDKRCKVQKIEKRMSKRCETLCDNDVDPAECQDLVEPRVQRLFKRFCRR